MLKSCIVIYSLYLVIQLILYYWSTPRNNRTRLLQILSVIILYNSQPRNNNIQHGYNLQSLGFILFGFVRFFSFAEWIEEYHKLFT